VIKSITIKCAIHVARMGKRNKNVGVKVQGRQLGDII
jgi:hypothetical protein